MLLHRFMLGLMLASALSLSGQVPAFERPLRVLCLGDSITAVPAEFSYRHPLWETFIQHGIEADFLGSQDDTPSLVEGVRSSRILGRNYDGQHEAHWGWTADDILEQLPTWLTLYPPPDLALIHLGTNDTFARQDEAETVSELESILRILRVHNPDMEIAVAQIFPGIWGDPRDLNDLIKRLETFAYLGPRVMVADCYSGIIISEDSYDGSHPNASGGNKMAAAWWEVLEPRLEPWKRTYASWTKQWPEQTLLPEADPDRDGWNNQFEYFSQTDPLDKTDFPSPLLATPDGQVVIPFDPLLAASTLALEAGNQLNQLNRSIFKWDDVFQSNGKWIWPPPFDPNDPVFFRWVTLQ